MYYICERIIVNTLKKNFTKYISYKLEDFLADESFIDWVKGNGADVKWEKVLKKYPHLEKLSEEAAFIIRNLNFHHVNPSENRIQDLKIRINKRIDKEFTPVQSDNKVLSLPISELISKRNKKRNIIMIAATFIGIVTISSLTIFKSNIDKIFFSEDKLITRVTGKGEKLTTYLSDGTKVVINGGSTITFKENFKDTIRKVILEGEAFFDVAKNPSKPFVVDANGTLTTALGTSFNINQNNDKVIVSLTTGKVSVVKNNEGNEFKEMLIPGEQIVADFNKSAVFLKQKFKENEVLGWMNGNLIFNEDRGVRVIEKLQNWYGITIEVKIDENELKNWSYSGSFQNEPLQNVLESISFVKEFKFKINGDLITIYK